MKPKEFWMWKTLQGSFVVATEAPDFSKEDYHVIEKSAYDKLIQDARVLRNILKQIEKAEVNFGHQPHIQEDGDLIATMEMHEAIGLATKSVADFDKKYPQLNEKE